MKKIIVSLISVLLLACICSPAAWANQQGATKEECVVKCHEAAALINSQGLEKAIEVLNDQNTRFVWKDSYVFLMDFNGKMLAHPFKPELTKKKHVLLMTDPTGKALFVHFVNLAKSTGEGWVDYMWPKPYKDTPRKKITYIYKVPGHELFVGAGVYVAGMMY